MTVFKSCKGCEERHPGCHGKCEKYQSERAEHERLKALYNSDREARIYTSEAMAKSKKITSYRQRKGANYNRRSRKRR